MVNKVYIVWCKLNKSTDKFDLGVFIDKKKADETMEAFAPKETSHSVGGKDAGRTSSAVWIKEYRLS